MQEEKQGKAQSGEGFSAKQWLETPPEMFDKREAFATHLKPLVDQLLALAIEHGIPLMIAADTACIDEGGCHWSAPRYSSNYGAICPI